MTFIAIRKSLRPFGAAACLSAGLAVSMPALAGAAADQRGFVSDGIAGGFLFQRCDGATPAPNLQVLKDKTPGGVLLAGIGEVRQVRQDADRPLYIEFRGAVSGTQITASRFHRAVGHVVSCASAPPALPADLRLLAEGGQPAWRLKSTPAGAHLEVVGKPAAQFQPVKMTASNTSKHTRAFSAKPTAGGAPIQVDLIEQACNDRSSETAYGASVVAQWGEQRFEGCAARY